MSQCSVYGLLWVICLMLFSGNFHLYLVRIPEHVILIMVLKLDLVLFKNISRSLSLEEGNKYNAFETLMLPGSWYCLSPDLSQARIPKSEKLHYMPNLFSEPSFCPPAKHTINQKAFSKGYYLYSNLSLNI